MDYTNILDNVKMITLDNVKKITLDNVKGGYEYEI